jgi:uncharacterized damage-inducible protein DinB
MSQKGRLAAFDHVASGTRLVLSAVPGDQLNWRPHERSWTLGELASHLANLPNWTVPTLMQSELELSPDAGGPPPRAAFSTKEEMLEAFENSVGTARIAIENSTDDDLKSPWTLLIDGAERFTMPKAAVLRSFVFDHMIHHRAQLGVYLRLLDVPVPQTFGPTADHPDM